MLLSTNFIANKARNLGNIMLNKTTSTLTFPSNTTTFNKQAICYKNPTVIRTNDIVATMDGYPMNGDQVYTFGPQRQRKILVGGTATNYVIQSADGVNYYGLGTSIVPFSPNDAASSDSLFLLGGSISNVANISYSYDGITYYNTNVSSLIGTGTTTVNGLSYNGKQWIAGGNGATTTTNSILYSYDGMNWLAGGLVGTNVYTASYNGSYWIAPVNTSPYLAYSKNGINWALATGTTGFSAAALDKCAAWNGALWVACGAATTTNGQCLAYTRDPTGASGWTPITLSSYVSGSVVSAVIWNGKMFLAAGWNGSVGTNAYSYNGINWTTYSVPITSARGQTLSWTGNMWIHGGNNKIIYSFDGISWHDTGGSLATNMTASTVNLYKSHSITFQRNLTISCGTTNSLSQSLDGINWTGLGLTSIFTTRGLCAKYNGRVWVAGGEGGNTLAYSYDGSTWNGLGSYTFTQACFNVVWNGTLWVGCGRTTSGVTAGTTLAYSYDGITWISSNNYNYFLPSDVNGGQSIAWNGSIWVSVGGGTPNMVYSYDGIKWTLNHLSIISGIIRTVATNGAMFLCGGDTNNTLCYSYDGLNWNALTISSLTSIRGIYWYSNKWVITGKGANTCFVYSYDGINWINSQSNIYSNTGLSVTHNGTMWISGGDGTANTLSYSYDGIMWTGLGTAAHAICNCVSSNYQLDPIPYIQQPSVAVGQGGNTIAYSETGINWKGLGKTIFSQVGNAVYWNGSVWVAGGQGGNTMAYSSDGLRWSALGSPVFSVVTNAISWNNIMWVASGNGGNTLAYSFDGTRWAGLGSTIFTNQGYGIVWNGVSWIIGGQGGNTLAYSSDSISWTGLVVDPLNTYIMSVATNGPLCIAAGLGTSYTLAYTLDSTVQTGWTGINNTVFSTSANSICWNGQIWVAVGEGTNTIAYSYTGISNWIGLGTGTFTTKGLDVCWNGVRFIATGQGGNSIAYSQNGMNWYNSYNGFSTSSTTNIFTYGNCVVSNPTIGASPIQSQMVLNKNIGLSDTLEVVSSDPYYQSGFDNVSIKIEPTKMNKIYSISLYSYTINYSITGPSVITTNRINYNKVISFTTVGSGSIYFNDSVTVDVLIVGGGGGGGGDIGGGGGSGGVIYTTLSLNAGTYNFSVGGGGAVADVASDEPQGTNGGNSSFGELIAYGGGGSYSLYNSLIGKDGGSGGGGSGSSGSGSGGQGVQIQGNNGGQSVRGQGGGGGGPAGPGLNGINTGRGGTGGGGNTYNITGVDITYGGGGGGGCSFTGQEIIGKGGGNGGNGGNSDNSPTNGTGYGGGGGGIGRAINTIGSPPNVLLTGGNGYQGVVILSFNEERSKLIIS